MDCAGGLELRDRGGGAEAGGQHGVDEDDVGRGEVRRGLEIIALGAMRRFVPKHADVSHADIRK